MVELRELNSVVPQVPNALQKVVSGEDTKATAVSESRGKWSNQFDFFLSCLGYAVGLGNVWRFPYLCYRNGGGAFLIPYVIMLVLVGLPMFFLELSLGQYHGKGPNVTFKHIAPIFHGVGYAMLVVTLLVVLYYNMIIAWTIFYTFASFTSQLGWEFCGNEWNSIGCFSPEQNRQCEEKNLTFWNNTCYDVEDYCRGLPNSSFHNTTHCLDELGDPVVTYKASERFSPSEDYYLHYMLSISPSIEEFGKVRWQLVLCLLGAWTIVALCLIKGVKSSGKVVYFTALFPYVVLIILLIRGATLEGAANGIYFYIVPKWEKLAHAQAWGDAAGQIFYSLGPGFGGLLTLASYNKFNNNCYRDAVIIAVSNCATSVFAGFVIFSILGFMAHTLNVDVENVIKSGPGLAFIAYPEAVTKMPLSPLWSFLFFFMLITLGLDSQFTMCETLITAVHDQFPELRRWKSTVVLLTCGIGFLLGIPLCAEAGVYLFTLIDWYAAGWSLLIIGFAELILISWIYGIERFKDNIVEMIGKRPNIYWTITWKYISPITTLGILLFSWLSYSPAKFDKYVLPRWANAMGWLMVLSSLIMMPIFAVYEVSKAFKKGKTIATLFRPSNDWGPAEQPLEILKDVEKKNGIDSYQSTADFGGYNNPAFSDPVKP